MNRVRFLLVVSLFGFAVIAAACTSSDNATSTDDTQAAGPDAQQGRDVVDDGEPVEGGSLTIAIQGETDGWHPSANNWTTEGHLVGSAMFETLMKFGADGSVEPSLAESVVPNDDFTSWTITIREGVLFHDGTVMDAEAVRQNLSTAMTSGLPALVMEGFVEQVVTLDERTVRVDLVEPNALVDRILAGVIGYIAAPSMLDNPEGSAHPVGTGPFEFEKWIRDGEITLTAFDDYWGTDDEGRQLPYLDELTFRVILDNNGRRQALEAGDVDLILTTNAGQIADARGDDSVVSIEDNFSEETFVMLNMGRPPFDNVHAREALAYGTNPESVITVTQDGVPNAATSPFADGTPWEVDDAGYVTYDPDRAREAVAAYEEDTGEKLKFRFSGVPVTDITQLQEFLAAEWAELGIEADIEVLEQTTYILQVVQGDYEAAWFRNYSFADPLTMAVFFHSRYVAEPGAISTNFSRVQNEAIDELVTAGMQTADQAERVEIYSEMARELNQELAHVWLFQTPFGLIGSPDVHGLNTAREVGFGNLDPKPWIGGLWIAP
jgi:peptide/nickel transport system substrate-binding protein